MIKLVAERPASPEAGEHSSVQERVYRALRLAIRRGRYRFGEILTIRGVAEAVGTSAMPVREALRRLVQDGVLELLPTGRVRVPLLSQVAFEELADTRSVLEGHAAALAARRLTSEQFRELRLLNDAMSKAIDRRDLPDMIACNERLHFGVYQAAGSALLLSTIENLWHQTGPYVAALIYEFSASNVPDLAIVHHYELLAALGKNDADKARAAIEADIAESAAWFRKVIFSDPVVAARK